MIKILYEAGHWAILLRLLNQLVPLQFFHLVIPFPFVLPLIPHEQRACLPTYVTHVEGVQGPVTPRAIAKGFVAGAEQTFAKSAIRFLSRHA
eukprot:COSAG01_NODE_6895_length_3448_cov_3.556285_2_plen_92_part_00